MIKVMSAGGESARSEASLIEVFERAIARLDATDTTANPTAESDYARFKQWEMLWRHNSPAEHQPDSSAGPVAPPSLNTWGGSVNFGRPAAIQATTPLSAMNWNFHALPHGLEEFSSMFGPGFSPGDGSLAGPFFNNGQPWM